MRVFSARIAVISTLALTFPTTSLVAQNEAALRQHFEGHSVVVRIDMPADSSGVEVRPEDGRPVDFSNVGRSIKQYGIGLHTGESVLITRIKVKKKQISFQLGGGGFGTFTDYLALNLDHPATAPQVQGKSDYERSLEAKLQWEQDPYRRDELRRELDRERRERSRDNAWSSEMAAQAAADQREDEQELRAHSGSRFTIHYSKNIGPQDLTPTSVMDALAEYVDFDNAGSRSDTARADTLSASDRAFAERGEREAGGAGQIHSGVTSLRNGQTIAQVEKLLGPARSADSIQEGRLEMNERIYSVEGNRVDARFVGGVLVSYQISPE